MLGIDANQQFQQMMNSSAFSLNLEQPQPMLTGPLFGASPNDIRPPAFASLATSSGMGVAGGGPAYTLGYGSGGANAGGQQHHSQQQQNGYNGGSMANGASPFQQQQQPDVDQKMFFNM